MEILWNFGKFLEGLERFQPQVFWLVLSVIPSVTSETIRPSQSVETLVVIEKQCLQINKCGAAVDSDFHRLAMKHFPDSKERLAYQKEREKFYKSAMKKKGEIKRLRIQENLKYYSKEELDAVDYCHGTGFYKKEQDRKMKPNIFDNRKSFILKMEDEEIRDKFLESYNNLTTEYFNSFSN